VAELGGGAGLAQELLDVCGMSWSGILMATNRSSRGLL
jgi:hypothetical protein